jgi:hypothetical protein
MRRKRLLWSAVVLACLIALLLAARYDPTHIVPGLLCNEAFFRGYPTGYWREVLRAEGRAGELEMKTVLTFEDDRAVPVLMELLADPDPDVRWPSVLLLQRAGSPGEVEPAVRGALDDPDLDVRLRAIWSLSRMRVAAMPAVPRLVQLSNDEDIDIRILAQFALWEIDPETASTVGGWQEFASEKWQFSVTMPGPPEEEVGAIDTPYGQVPIHLFGVSYGVARCSVAVTEYSQQSIEELPLQDRFDAALGETAKGLGGSLVRYDPIEQHGYSGRDKVIEIDGRAMFHSRVFPVGRRGYQINITFPRREALSPRAEEFFLGSLRITYSPESAAEQPNGPQESDVQQ